jgi:hypothetical protein
MKKELSQQEIDENNALHKEMVRQITKGDISGFLKNVEIAKKKGFVDEKQYKKHMKKLTRITNTKMRIDDMKERGKEKLKKYNPFKKKGK